MRPLLTSCHDSRRHLLVIVQCLDLSRCFLRKEACLEGRSFCTLEADSGRYFFLICLGESPRCLVSKFQCHVSGIQCLRQKLRHGDGFFLPDLGSGLLCSCLCRFLSGTGERLGLFPLLPANLQPSLAVLRLFCSNLPRRGYLAAVGDPNLFDSNGTGLVDGLHPGLCGERDS